MDRHAATRRLRHLAEAAGIQITRTHPHMLRHALLSTSFDAGVDLRDVQIAARHADPRTTMRYDNSRVLHQAGGKPQVSRSRSGLNRLHCPREPCDRAFVVQLETSFAAQPAVTLITRLTGNLRSSKRINLRLARSVIAPGPIPAHPRRTL
jgi:hypothetical protein